MLNDLNDSHNKSEEDAGVVICKSLQTSILSFEKRRYNEKESNNNNVITITIPKNKKLESFQKKLRPLSIM